MSENWVADISDMQRKFGFIKVLDDLAQKAASTGEGSQEAREKLRSFLSFRWNFLAEELTEMKTAIDSGSPEEVVDALIDICVVAIGTLDLFAIDEYAAWDRVHEANMTKQVGVKESRPNPFGFPDLVKPEDWVKPSHYGNHGYVTYAFEKVRKTVVGSD